MASARTLELNVSTKLLTVAYRIVADYFVVDSDYAVTVADVDIVPDSDMRAGAADPAASLPTVVVDTMPMPVAIAVQPGTDRESDAKGNESVPSWGGFNVNRHGIILGDIHHIGFGWNDTDDPSFVNHLLLSSGYEIPFSLCLCTQALDRIHHILRLTGVSLPQGYGPVILLVHHEEHVGIMGYRLDTHIPLLVVDQGGFPVLSHITDRQIDLIDKRRRREDLGEQRIRVERNGSEQIIQFLRSEESSIPLFHCVGRSILVTVGNCDLPCEKTQGEECCR